MYSENGNKCFNMEPRYIGDKLAHPLGVIWLAHAYSDETLSLYNKVNAKCIDQISFRIPDETYLNARITEQVKVFSL